MASADKQKCSGVGQKSIISGFLQPASFGPKTKQLIETYTRSEQSQQIPQGRKIQIGNTRNDPDLPTDRGVDHVHRFQGRLLPHRNTKPIKKISEISCTGQNIPVHSTCTTIWPVHSSQSDQRGQTDGFAEGYKNPPVPRRLVGPAQIPPNFSLAYTDTSSTLSGPRLASKHGKVGTGPQASFLLCRLPVRPERGQGQTHPRLVGRY